MSTVFPKVVRGARAWGLNEMVSYLLVATTLKNFVCDRKSAVFLCTIRVGWQSRPLQKKASLVEVAVAPIIGHTSSPHRMHATKDEKNEHMMEKTMSSTCSFLSSFLSFPLVKNNLWRKNALFFLESKLFSCFLSCAASSGTADTSSNAHMGKGAPTCSSSSGSTFAKVLRENLWCLPWLASLQH